MDMVEQLLSEIDETNFHVCGSNWNHLNDLIDSPEGGFFGTLQDWVVCLNNTVHTGPFDDSDAVAVHRIAGTYGHEILGVSREEWAALEGVSCGKVREALTKLLEQRKAGDVMPDRTTMLVWAVIIAGFSVALIGAGFGA